MKKRAIFGVGAASLAVGLLSASGAFASSLDYAMSVGQVEMGDTVNYVIEATSDGGYIAGGQTIQCFKVMPEMVRAAAGKISRGGWIQKWIEGEVVPMAECEEYYSTYGGPKAKGGDLYSYRNKVDTPAPRAIKAADTDDESSVNFYDYCKFPVRGATFEKAKQVSAVSAIAATAPTMRLAELDPEADYYKYSCVDYAAKFKKDGTKEWLSTIRNGDIPVAVGETANDYRLLTENGMLYTFAKTDGEKDDDISTDVSYVKDAIINQDGTTVVASGHSIVLLGNDATIAKELEGTDTTTEWSSYEDTGSDYSKPLVRTENGFIAVKYTEELVGTDEDGEEVWEDGMSIVEVSTDLNTVKTLLTFDQEDVDALDGDIEVLSADKDGNIAILAPIDLTGDGNAVDVIVTVDKDGNAIGGTTAEELFGSGYKPTNEYDEAPLFVDNLTLVNPNTKKLARLTPELTEIDNYPLADGEMIYDAVLLNDDSLAAVGRASTSTANYTVDGNMNGTYLRLTAKTASSTTNPQTGDDLNVAIISGVVVAMLLAGAAAVVGKRR